MGLILNIDAIYDVNNAENCIGGMREICACARDYKKKYIADINILCRLTITIHEQFDVKSNYFLSEYMRSLSAYIAESARA